MQVAGAAAYAIAAALCSRRHGQDASRNLAVQSGPFKHTLPVESFPEIMLKLPAAGFSVRAAYDATHQNVSRGYICDHIKYLQALFSVLLSQSVSLDA